MVTKAHIQRHQHQLAYILMFDAQISLSYSCGKLNGEVAQHADIFATILARMSVSVLVSWNADVTVCTLLTVN